LTQETLSDAQFLQLVDDNQARIQRIAKSYAPGGELNDLVQEILLQLWRSRASFRGDASMDTWLYRVALNTAMSFRRKKRDPIAVDGRAEQIDAIGNPLDPAELLQSFLRSLGDADRLAMLLFLEGLSTAQIADVLGSTKGAVAVRMSRLKQRFENEFVEEST
jgi:RNA polymerase sigma-70 factor (ECF subfamily)